MRQRRPGQRVAEGVEEHQLRPAGDRRRDVADPEGGDAVDELV